MHQNLEGSAKVTPDFRPFDATTRRPYNLNAPGAPHPWYRTRLSKFLFSATLGDDPQQLNAMKLSRPLFLYSAVVDGQEVVKHLDGLSAERFFKDRKGRDHAREPPGGLTESAVSCDAASKPVALFALLGRARGVPADHRVLQLGRHGDAAGAPGAALVSEEQWLGGEECVLALSSAAGAARRDAIIKEVGGAWMRSDMPCGRLVASDALARGVDLPSVSLMTNYDAPRDASNYVHRVGRAALAPARPAAPSRRSSAARTRTSTARGARSPLRRGAARVRRCAEPRIPD